MSLGDMLEPFLIILDWSKSYHIEICGFSFTFFEVFIYITIVSIFIAFLKSVLER